jgi:hypothetical protein
VPYRTLTRLSLALILSFLLSLTPVQSVRAQEPWIIRVTTTQDLRNYGHNSVCSAGDATKGPCSLRAAVFEAAHDPSGDVIVEVPPGVYRLTLTASSGSSSDEDYGDLDFPALGTPRSAGILIRGIGDWENPSIIEANYIDRVMQIGANQQVRLENLVLRNGLVTSSAGTGSGTDGGGLYISDASLQMNHVRLSNNEARGNSSTLSSGGAIYTAGSNLELNQCELSYNKSDVGSALAGTQSQDTLIQGSTLRHNTVNQSTGAHIELDSWLVMTNSTMSDNQGGAYYVKDSLYTLIQNSTLVSSAASGFSGILTRCGSGSTFCR